MSAPNPQSILNAVQQALAEDLSHGDVTTGALFPSALQATATIVAHQPMTVAGVAVAREVFLAVDPSVHITTAVKDGSAVKPETSVLTVRGDIRSLLMAERVAVNFLQQLSGIATLTAQFCAAVRGYPTRILDTRKTTPGLRTLEKWAVQLGGGKNHRFSLGDGVLIKDNHLRAAGGVTEAIALARQSVHHLLRVQVEVTTLDELREALEVGVDAVLLDNMDDRRLADAIGITRAHPKGAGVVLEASGNMTAERIARLNRIGLDLVSMGGLVHQSRWADLSMEIAELDRGIQ